MAGSCSRQLSTKVAVATVVLFVVVVCYATVSYESLLGAWNRRCGMYGRTLETAMDFQTDLERDPKEMATELKRKFRLVVWIMTQPDNYEKKARHVKETWGRHADTLLFMSSKEDKSLPAIGLGTGEGRENLTEKHMKAFQYVHDNYLDKADWFMKADDDSFVIFENLYQFLMDKNSSEPIWYGQPLPSEDPYYFSGGGGYVISKEALRRFGRDQKKYCRQKGGVDDCEMGHCMNKLGVKLGQDLDHLGRGRFFSQPPGRYIFGDHKTKKGISNYPISFHYVTPEMMHVIEFFTYQVKIFSKSYLKSEMMKLKRKQQMQASHVPYKKVH